MKIVKIDSIACMSCIIMNNVFNEVKQRYDFDLLEYDFDEDYEVVEKYNVKTLPAYIFFKNEKEINRLVGEHKKKEFEDILKGCEKS